MSANQVPGVENGQPLVATVSLKVSKLEADALAGLALVRKMVHAPTGAPLLRTMSLEEIVAEWNRVKSAVHGGEPITEEAV